jgi:hypothetical protein
LIVIGSSDVAYAGSTEYGFAAVVDDDAWVALAGACGAGTVCAYVAAVVPHVNASTASDVRTVLPTDAFGVEVVREVIRSSPPLGVERLRPP